MKSIRPAYVPPFRDNRDCPKCANPPFHDGNGRKVRMEHKRDFADGMQLMQCPHCQNIEVIW